MLFAPLSQTFDKLITIPCTGPTFIPRRHSLRALKAFYVEWFGLYPLRHGNSINAPYIFTSFSEF